jgi:hypothetical protein
VQKHWLDWISFSLIVNDDGPNIRIAFFLNQMALESSKN